MLFKSRRRSHIIPWQHPHSSSSAILPLDVRQPAEDRVLSDIPMASSRDVRAGPVPTNEHERDDLESRIAEKSEREGKANESNVVDWEGPDDAAHPRNWKPATKLTHVLLVSAFTLYS